MNKQKPNLLLLLAIALFATVVVFDIAYGSGIDVEVETTVIGGDQIGGDNTASNVATNSIAGSRSYGLGLGDVDINDCLYSWSFIVQGVGLNKWCASERMDVMGLHDSAAMMRCTIRQVKKLYENKDQCIKAQTVVEVFHVERPAATVDTDEDDDDRYEALYARMATYEERTVKAEAEAKTASIQAQRASTTAKTVQIAQQAPDDAAKRRAKARVALKGEE